MPLKHVCFSVSCSPSSPLSPPFSFYSSSCSLPAFLYSLPPASSLAPAAGTTASSNAGAMNSLTSLGTLQGLAGATVGLNNINALAGSVNSEYSPCHQPLHLHLHFQPPILTYLTAASLQQPATWCRETKSCSHTMQLLPSISDLIDMGFWRQRLFI